MPKIRSPQARRQSGITMVEFVIISPFAILVVMAIIQLGLVFCAKQVLNEAAFSAARYGAMNNAHVDGMRRALQAALVPFYQDATTSSDLLRLTQAKLSATLDTATSLTLNLTRLNPSAAAFQDFGLTDAHNNVYIPNDSLDYRPHTVTGPSSGLSIQDANTLKIEVTYSYPLKVPLMAVLFKSLRCGMDSGLSAFGRGGLANLSSDCAQFYAWGRVPIRTVATVQMQTPAYQN